MKLNKELKFFLLIIIMIGTPLLIIGLFNLGIYIIKTIECHSSTENLIRCHLESVCKEKNINYNCFDELKESVSEITNKALKENNSKICEEIESQLRFICYYQFAKKLKFSLNEVFINNLKGQDEKLCNDLEGLLRKKCFFNLAIERLNENFCKETGEYAQRCSSNILLLRNGTNQKDIRSILNSRITENASKLNIKFSLRWNANKYLVGERGVLDLYNDGDKKLDGSKFNLYKNLRLVDIDGCEDNPVVYPKKLTKKWDLRHCILEFNTKVAGHILEVTYDGETVLVN